MDQLHLGHVSYADEFICITSATTVLGSSKDFLRTALGAFAILHFIDISLFEPSIQSHFLPRIAFATSWHPEKMKMPNSTILPAIA